MMMITWLGDENESIRVITQGGHTFPHSEPVLVPDDDPSMALFLGNRFFSVESDQEAGTEAVNRKPGRPAKSEDGSNSTKAETE